MAAAQRTSQRTQGPSIRDVATALGMSKSAVSLALSKDEADCPLAPDTRRRIVDGALAMGYRPNAIARTMRTGKFDAVALLMGSSSPRYLPADLVFATNATLADHGQHLIFAQVADDRLSDDVALPKVLEQWCADGLLIYHDYALPARMAETIERHAIPSVWVNAKLDRDCVYLDDEAAARDATRRMIELGHRRVAYLNLYCDDHYSVADRRTGYASAMRDAGLTPRITEQSSPNRRDGYMDDRRWTAAESLLSGDPVDRPTAVLCYEIGVAGALMLAAARRGLRVPGDLSVTAFGRPEHNQVGTAITLVNDGLDAVGHTAAAAILERITRPQLPVPATAVPMPLVDPDATVSPVGKLGQDLRTAHGAFP